MICNKCGEEDMRHVGTEDLDDNFLDNVLEIYECQKCGHLDNELKHIG